MIEYQNIVIAPDVFRNISRFFGGDPDIEDIDLKSYRETLRLKCLILDREEHTKGVYASIKEIINQSNDFSRNKLELLIDEFLQSNRIKFERLDKESEFVRNREHNYLFNLASSSKTNIINSELDFLLYKTQVKDFEILNIDEIINPPSGSSAFAFSRDIELIKNDSFNIYEVLKYYWINTKTLIIEDDYLRKKDDLINIKEGQFSKLILLLKACKNLEKLLIRTPFNDSTQNSKGYLTKEEFEQEIINQTAIHPEIENKKVGERHYYTDYFKIHMGKGLDFFNIKNGFRVYRPKVTIRITPIKQLGNG